MESNSHEAAASEWGELKRMHDLQRICSLAAVSICRNYAREHAIYEAGPDTIGAPGFPEVTLDPQQHSFGDYYLNFTFEPFDTSEGTAGSIEITQTSDDSSSGLWHQIEQEAALNQVDTSAMASVAKKLTLFVTDDEVIECEEMSYFFDENFDEVQVLWTDEQIITADVGENSDISRLDRTVDNTQQIKVLEAAMLGLDMLHTITRTRAEAASLLARNINHLQDARPGDLAVVWGALQTVIDQRNDYVFNYESDRLTVISLSAIADRDAQIDIRYIQSDEPGAEPYSCVKISYVNGASVEYLIDCEHGTYIQRDKEGSPNERPMTALEAIEIFDFLQNVTEAQPLPQSP